MTTYAGKRAGYVPGKRPVNKEPPVAKYVIEKLYQVHRERLQKVTSLLDTHVVELKFLTDTTWKKTAQFHQEYLVMKHNEEMYERLAKVENGESILAREKREHIKKVSDGSKIMNRLKKCDRERKIMAIQKENEIFYERLVKAKGEYANDKLKEWYEHHLRFKRGRRADVTAGHIMNTPKRLLPNNLPPIQGRRSVEELESKINSLTENGSSVDSLSYNRKLGSLSSGGSSSKIPSQIVNNAAGLYDVPAGVFSTSSESKRFLKFVAPVKAPITKGLTQNRPVQPKDTAADNKADQEMEGIVTSNLHSFMNISDYEEEGEESMDSCDAGSMDEDLAYVIVSCRQFPIPFQHKNCIVQVFLSEQPDDVVYFRVISATEPYQVLADRSLHIDAFFDALGSALIMPHGAAGDNVSSLRALLSNMFHEADTDKSGNLTFDEFHDLMEKIDLGITNQELRFVMSEADENADGVVDYEEFVPMACDMIMAFRARTNAKKQYSEAVGSIDNAVHKVLRSNSEISRISTLCLEKIRQADSKKQGYIRVNDLRRCLQSVAAVGLSPIEINMICQTLPRDPFGRCIYENFEKILYEVRFIAMKNMIIESQGSQTQKYLFELCRQEEQKIREDIGDDVAVPGMIPFRNLVNLLVKSPRLSLTRLQVMVIVSEANVVDGMVDYRLFVPAAAKAIEMMFDPSSLRMRSELLDNVDFSSGGSNGEQNEQFHKRLASIFQAHDTRQTGDLSAEEFSQCMQSLDLQLTEAEIFALMASADLDHSGTISFEEFVHFCSHNLVQLEQEKKLRLMQKESKEMDKKQEEGRKEKTQQQLFDDIFQGHLFAVFEAADKDKNGVLDSEEIYQLLHSLDIKLTQFQLDVLLSEMDTNDDNQISYAEFVPVCAELLQAFHNRAVGKISTVQQDKLLTKQAFVLAGCYSFELKLILKFLFERILLIVRSVEDEKVRRSTIKELLYNPFTGLCKCEASMIFAKLCPSVVSENSDTLLDEFLSLSRNEPEKLTGKHKHKSRHTLLNEELFLLIKRVRETTIKRGLLDVPEMGKIESKLVHLCVAESRNMQKSCGSEGPQNSDPNYLPLRSCFHILISESTFRLSLFQVLHVIQYIDCLEIGCTSVNYRYFCSYAAAKLVYLTTPSVVEDRGDIVKFLDWSESQYMNELNEPEFLTYCKEKFSAVADTSGYVNETQFFEIVSGIPKIGLSFAETLAVASAFPRVNDRGSGKIKWREFMPWGYSIALMVCRERYIGRRLLMLSILRSGQISKARFETIMEHQEELSKEDSPNHRKDASEEAQANKLFFSECKTFDVGGKIDVFAPLDPSTPMVANIDKLFDVLKLVKKGENLSLVFPNEKIREKDKGSVNVSFDKPSTAMVNVLRRATTLDVEAVSGDLKLFTVSKFLPIAGSYPQEIYAVNVAPHGIYDHGPDQTPIESAFLSRTHSVVKMDTGTGNFVYEVNWYLPCMITPMVSSLSQTSMEKQLKIHVQSFLGGNTINSVLVVPVKLPSVGLVDKESAIQFATNVIDMLQIGFTKGKPYLVV